MNINKVILDDKYWMKQALQEALRALPIDVPVGAVLVDSVGNLLSSSYNQRERNNSVVGHAELLALEEAAGNLTNWRLEDCTLYVTLEPCLMCTGAIIQSRVKRLVFGAYDLKDGAMGSVLKQGLKAELEVTGGVLEEECSDLLKKFFEAKR
jgi:tRNA(adenine34) deaminase